jgi:hypothetical protein
VMLCPEELLLCASITSIITLPLLLLDAFSNSPMMGIYVATSDGDFILVGVYIVGFVSSQPSVACRFGCVGWLLLELKSVCLPSVSSSLQVFKCVCTLPKNS